MREQTKDAARVALTLAFGVVGIIAPFASLFVLTVGQKTDISSFNSMTLMLLSVLLMVFLVINCANNFFSNHKKLFLAGLILLILSLFSFAVNIPLFLSS